MPDHTESIHETDTDAATSPADLFTLEEVAQLADKTDQFSSAIKDKLRSLVRSDPSYAPQLAELERLAQDAGLPETNDRLYAGWLFNQEFDRLLEAEDWQHPAEILDPDGNLGIGYQELINIAESRARRLAPTAAAAHQEVCRKLSEAHKGKQSKSDCVEVFVNALLTFDPEDAELLLGRAARAYRFHRR